MEHQEIKNQWCIYEGCSVKKKKSLRTKVIEKITGQSCHICGIGKIIEQYSQTVAVLHSESASPQLWSKMPFDEWRYETLEEAIEEYCNSFNKSEEKVMETVRQDFPSYFKNNSK